MQKQNRALKILSGRSGASLLFVLAVMLLLMAVGVSALVSAGANLNAGINKQLDNRLNIYADSLHRAIMSSLKAGQTNDIGKYVAGGIVSPPTTLGGQLLSVIYNEADALLLGADPNEDFYATLYPDDPNYLADLDSDIEFTHSFTGGGPTSNITGIEIKIKFKALSVHITPYEANEIVEIRDETDTVIETNLTPAKPKRATINGSATVTVTATLPAGLAEKSVISVVTYDFLDGFIEEELGADESSTGNMKIIKAGDWRFLSSERVDKGTS